MVSIIGILAAAVVVAGLLFLLSVRFYGTPLCSVLRLAAVAIVLLTIALFAVKFVFGY